MSTTNYSLEHDGNNNSIETNFNLNSDKGTLEVKFYQLEHEDHVTRFVLGTKTDANLYIYLQKESGKTSSGNEIGVGDSVESWASDDTHLLNIDAWNEIVLRWEDGTAELFVNGTLEKSFSFSWNGTAENFRIGRVEGSEFPSGYIAYGRWGEVRVWDTALPESDFHQEITEENYDLKAWWPIVEGSGGTVEDYGPHRADGSFGTTANAMTWEDGPTNDINVIEMPPYYNSTVIINDIQSSSDADRFSLGFSGDGFDDFSLDITSSDYDNGSVEVSTTDQPIRGPATVGLQFDSDGFHDGDLEDGDYDYLTYSKEIDDDSPDATFDNILYTHQIYDGNILSQELLDPFNSDESFILSNSTLGVQTSYGEILTQPIGNPTIEIQPERMMMYLIPYQADLSVSQYIQVERTKLQLSAYTPEVVLDSISVGIMARTRLKGYSPKVIAEKSLEIQPERAKFQLKSRIPSVLADEIILVTARGASKLQAYEPDIYMGTSEKIEITERGGLKLSAFIPKFTTNLLENISWNDDVFLLVRDSQDNIKFYRGIVRDIDEKDRWIDIDAITGDGILAERKVKENYPSQDIGTSVQDMVNEYGRPITTVNVKDTGIEAPIKAKGKTIVKVLEELRRRYNVNFYVDNTWDLNFYSEEEIIENEDKHITIKLGE